MQSKIFDLHTIPKLHHYTTSLRTIDSIGEQANFQKARQKFAYTSHVQYPGFHNTGQKFQNKQTQKSYVIPIPFLDFPEKSFKMQRPVSGLPRKQSNLISPPQKFSDSTESLENLLSCPIRVSSLFHPQIQNNVLQY